MIKVKDLMIGDYINSSFGIAQVISIDKVGVTLINKDNGEFDIDFLDNDAWLQEIPLTPEILEKNFEKKTFFGIFDDYFDLTIREYSDSLYIVDYHCCEMSLPDQQVTVCFVHELQHFLMHCGISKKILL